MNNIANSNRKIKKGKRSQVGGISGKKGENSPIRKVKPVKNKSEMAGPAGAAPDGACLEGMSSAELMMVRKLAGNDPVARKKTLRKLKKWLNVLSQKVPDTPDCRAMIEPNFIRVWKALFYCMWMADKPLPQEQLAESLSDLQTIFATKTQPFLLFVEWFMRTIAREWNWIDRFRMDKFMMLFRRFLRKSLMVIAEKKWQNDILLGYTNIVAGFIFNRQPKAKKGQHTIPATAAPLGLQIHFIDVFMEELAKVGGEKLKFQKILKILAVFIQELGYNNDDRLLGEIRERIFNHLMRQSDVGIDYQEQIAFGGEEEEEMEDDEDLEDNADTDANEEEGDDEMMDDMEESIEMDGHAANGNEPLDPRAGAVDVILPQLDIDYKMLYQKLIEYGGQKDLKLKNRRILYSLASQFKELTEGKYPLALPEDNYTAPAIPGKEVTKAAKRLVEMEEEEGTDKHRKTKKQRKREAKKKLNLSSASADSIGSEDNSRYINDDELLDHVSDNYMSYLEDEIEGGADSVDGVAEQSVTEAEETGTPKGKGKKAKKVKDDRKRKWTTVVEVEADEMGSENAVDVDAVTETTGDERGQEEEVILIQKPKLGKKRHSLGILVGLSTPPPLKGKNRRVSELRTPINKSSPLNDSLNSSANKRVSFVLARNKEHEHADYSNSIARSPAIPFDKDRRPSIGLLKSPATTPNSGSYECGDGCLVSFKGDPENLLRRIPSIL